MKPHNIDKFQTYLKSVSNKDLLDTYKLVGRYKEYFKACKLTLLNAQAHNLWHMRTGYTVDLLLSKQRVEGTVIFHSTCHIILGLINANLISYIRHRLIELLGNPYIEYADCELALHLVYMKNYEEGKGEEVGEELENEKL